MERVVDFDPNVSGEKITPMAKKTTAVVIRVVLPIDNGGGYGYTKGVMRWLNGMKKKHSEMLFV